MDITQIKLGGSLITDKSKPYTARLATIKRLAKEIKRASNENPKLHLIIGNGGGSFPHTSASKYGTANGYTDDKGKFGFCLVQNDAATINRICLKEFLKEGISTLSVSPNNIILTNNKAIGSISLLSIEETLDRGIIPFVYGDTLLDTKIGSCIYSCDQVMSTLSHYLPKDRYHTVKVISVGDFPGVLDSNNKPVNIIDKVVYQKLLSSGAIKGSQHTDVTGGMKAKLDEMMKLADSGVESIILDGSRKDNLYNVLTGRSYTGTKIKI